MLDASLDFFTKNKDAFTSIGILITFLVSAFSLYFSARNNKAVHFVNSVTKSRIEWIQDLRSNVAEFISITNIYNNVYYKKNYEKSGIHLSRCQQSCTKIKLLLNYCDDKDKNIINLCEEILEGFRKYCDFVHNCKVDNDGHFVDSKDMNKCKKQVENDIDKLSKAVQIYLKAEWNRVKYESQGKIYEKETQDFDYNELEMKYDNPMYKSKVWKRFFVNCIAKIKRNIVRIVILGVFLLILKALF